MSQLLGPVQGYPAFSVPCCVCGKTLHSWKTAIYVDRNGRAFDAYFCAQCNRDQEERMMDDDDVMVN